MFATFTGLVLAGEALLKFLELIETAAKLRRGYVYGGIAFLTTALYGWLYYIAGDFNQDDALRHVHGEIAGLWFLQTFVLEVWGVFFALGDQTRFAATDNLLKRMLRTTGYKFFRFAIILAAAWIELHHHFYKMPCG